MARFQGYAALAAPTQRGGDLRAIGEEQLTGGNQGSQPGNEDERLKHDALSPCWPLSAKVRQHLPTNCRKVNLHNGQRLQGMGAELARIDLTQQQSAFVKALLNGASNEEAMTKAGYADSIHPSQILSSAAVQRAIVAGCDAELRGDLRLKAIRALERLLDGQAPPATMFNAAKFVLEYGQDAEKGDGKSPTEMSIAELEALIDRKEAALKDVTPSNGAHP